MLLELAHDALEDLGPLERLATSPTRVSLDGEGEVSSPLEPHVHEALRKLAEAQARWRGRARSG